MAVFASLKVRARGVERDVALEPSGQLQREEARTIRLRAEQRWLTT